MGLAPFERETPPVVPLPGTSTGIESECAEWPYCADSTPGLSPMSPPTRRKSPQRRGQTAKAPSHADLAGVVRQTARLWRKHHLGYDQTKYVVEQVRRRLGLTPPATRPRTVERLDRAEVERLIA